MQRGRLILASAVAPAVPALILSAFIVGMTIAAGNFDRLGSDVAFVAFFAGVVSYAHAIVLGIPVALWLGRNGRLTLLPVLAYSALIGALPYSILMTWWELDENTGSVSFDGVAHTIDGTLTLDGWLNHAQVVLMFAGYGIASGLVWWWLAVRPAGKHAALAPQP